MYSVKKVSFVTLIALLLSINLYAQEGIDKQVNPFHKHYADSLKTMNYDRTFPLMAKNAYKKGYDIPLPYGVSAIYMYLRQEIDITNTSIAFNDNPSVDLSDILKYGSVMNTTNVYTVRPNMWVLPFLSVYGIMGMGHSQVVVPVVEPIVFTTTQEFSLKTGGVGLTLAGGLGPFFLTADGNVAWTWLEALNKPVPAYNFDTRIGHSFVSATHPERNLTVWIGAFFQTLSSQTTGEIQMSDVMSADAAQKMITQLENRIDTEYPNLKPAQKKMIDNIISDGVEKLENSTVHYELDKEIAGKWNMIFGAQYQHNKHWQARCEVGTFGKRSQFMLNLNYAW
jgi:hypothetical protein